MTKGKSSAAIAAEIEEQRRKEEAAHAELHELKAARPAMLRSGDDEALEAHDRRIAKVERAIERAAALGGDLLPHLTQARAAEAEAARQAAYRKAQRAADEYRRIVEKEYAPAARKLASILAALRDQAALTEAANADLPAGSAPLAVDSFRDEPEPAPKRGKPRKVERTYWVDAAGYRIAGEPMMVNGKLQTNGLEMRTEIVEERADPSPARRRTSPPSLELAVILPGVLFCDPDFWNEGATS